MSDGGEESGIGIWTIAKTVVITAGLIYLVSLVTWFAKWATVLVAVAGMGYLGYRIAEALPRQRKSERKLLRTESTFDTRMRQLEEEERVLDFHINA